MSTITPLLSPPECVRGMTRLDKSLFDKTISVPFVEVEDGQQMEGAIDCLKPFLLKLKQFNPIEVKSEEENKRIIVLNPEMISTLDDITKEDTNCKHILQDLCQIKEVKFKDIVITYDNYNHKSILDSVLSTEEGSVSSFSTIGHVLHLNLKEHNLPFKQLIGQVLLDKIVNSDLVVNKVNTINNEFRNFEMEVLAKRSEEVNTIVKIKESFCEFEFDFAKVYWNQRLGTEHERIQLKLAKGVDVLYDVFAGVGPFAIPAAKRRKCEVLANDLNPECYKWLEHNRKLNKVEDRVKIYNMDGRDFIRDVVREDLLNRIKDFDGTEMNRRYHIAMNLPALAIEFLDAFKGLLSATDPSIDHKIIPVIHCYCFVKNEPTDGSNVVKRMAEEVLDHNITELLEIVNIRKVAPNKDMFRISFLMPEPVLYSKPDSNKKQRTE